MEMIPKACGVKRKATVGRPLTGRYKDPLERRKHTPKPKTTTVPETIKTRERNQQPLEEPTIDARTQGSFLSQINMAHTSLYGNMLFTHQFQGGLFYGNDLPQINRRKEFGS